MRQESKKEKMNTEKRIEKLERELEVIKELYYELRAKHIHMENAIKRKAGMLEPIRPEGWKFKI